MTDGGSEAARSRAALAAFAVGVGVLVLLKLVLRSDLSILASYTPHDDSLYVERAWYLLAGEGFGPYDSRVLLKYPGISLWLAGTHTLGIPFMLSVDVLYIAAGLYVVTGLLKAGAPGWILLGALALYLFNPVTFGDNWWRVRREPLDTALFVTMTGAMAHILARVRDRMAWLHLAVFSLAFAFSMFVREENRLLWALLGLFLSRSCGERGRSQRWTGVRSFLPWRF